MKFKKVLNKETIYPCDFHKEGLNFGSIFTGDIFEEFKVILHLHQRAVSQANRQTSEVKLSGIPSAFEEPVKKGNVKRVVKICTSKVWDLTG